MTDNVLQNVPAPKATVTARMIRLVLLLIYFSLGCLVIIPMLLAGAPLYLINKDLYYRNAAWVKKQIALSIFSTTQWSTSTKIYISGDETVVNQLHKLPDGRLQCDFPSRLVLLANHQMYHDWVYLWWAAYTSQPSTHGNFYIVLKRIIIYVPIIGLALRSVGFVFLSRNIEKDSHRLERRINQLRRQGLHGLEPMWFLIFPEGTNLNRAGRAKSAGWARKQGIEDMQHLLLPHSTGTYLCLKRLGDTVDWVYDCTLTYDGVPEGQYGQDIHTLRSIYINGHSPPIHMHWRRFKVFEIPLAKVEDFNDWLQKRWLEKDTFLSHYAEEGCFTSALARNEQITTEVQLGHLWELWSFGVVLLLTITLSVVALNCRFSS